METGIIGVSEGALAAESARFGGIKDSGHGREGSTHRLAEYRHIADVRQARLDGCAEVKDLGVDAMRGSQKPSIR